jgi:ribonucleoside-diphosphate reductase alpha chain/ribonucleoside-diphosphate reductase subunit M1
MYVLKRSGTREIVSFDKTKTHKDDRAGGRGKINYTNLVIKVIDQLYDNISTTKLDELSAGSVPSWRQSTLQHPRRKNHDFQPP